MYYGIVLGNYLLDCSVMNFLCVVVVFFVMVIDVYCGVLVFVVVIGCVVLIVGVDWIKCMKIKELNIIINVNDLIFEWKYNSCLWEIY